MTVRHACLTLAMLCAIVGCSDGKPGPTLPAADQIYTLRGKIETLPVKDKPLSDLILLHEPIDAFVDMHGKVVGMDSMSMPFTPDRAVDLSKFAVGDVVEFTFEVRWKQSPRSLLTRMSKLAPGTEIKLGKAVPAPKPEAR
ncbi:MAG: copper-binding protein [Phycisphaerales bacterium]